MFEKVLWRTESNKMQVMNSKNLNNRLLQLLYLAIKVMMMNMAYWQDLLMYKTVLDQTEKLKMMDMVQFCLRNLNEHRYEIKEAGNRIKNKKMCHQSGITH